MSFYGQVTKTSSHGRLLIEAFSCSGLNFEGAKHDLR